MPRITCASPTTLALGAGVWRASADSSVIRPLGRGRVAVAAAGLLALLLRQLRALRDAPLELPLARLAALLRQARALVAHAELVAERHRHRQRRVVGALL